MGSKRTVSVPERARRKNTSGARSNRRAAKSAVLRPGGSRHSLENLLAALREFVLVFDGQGVVRNLWSSGPKRISGHAAVRPGQRLGQLVDKEALAWIRRATKESRRTGHSRIAIHSVPLADEVRTYAMSVMPFAWGSGAREKLACLIARDATMVTLDRRAQLEKEALLAQAEELANVGSWEVDLETDTVRWSSHFFRMLGATPENEPQPGNRGLQVIHPDDLETALRDRDRAVRKGVPLDNELRFVTAHRGTRVFHSRAIPLRDREGRIVRIRGMSQDVTERREAEEKLREREALLAHAEQIARLGSWQYEFTTKRVTLSANLRRIFGLGPDDEFSSELYWSRVHPEDRDRSRAIRDRCAEEGKAFEYEVRYLPPEGGTVFLSVRGVTLFDSAGKPLRRTGVVQDITAQRQADERLRGREAMLDHAEEIANLGSFQYDVATRKATLSPNLRNIFGLRDGEEWNSASCWERVHPQDRDRARQSMAQGAESGKPFEFVMRFTPPGGAMRYLQVRGSPQADPTGKVTHLIGVVQDITEQREIEESLRERQALLTHAEHIANLGSWQLDLATDRATLSPYLMEYYGLTAGDNWNRELLWSRVHRDDRPWAEQAMRQATEEKRSFDFVARCLLPGGGVRFVRFRGEPLLDAEGKAARRVGVVQDITDQREVEEKLRERAATIEYAEKVAKLGSWRYDYATDSFTLSPNMRRILGIGPDDPWSSELYWSRVPAADRARAQAIFERATAERKPFEFVARFAPMNGGMAHLYTRGITFCDASGELTHRVGVVQDITEQLRAEEDLRRLSQQLLRARDDDRRRIARELHESAGQSLAALKMTLGRLRQVLGVGTEAARSLLASSVELADAAVREVRTVSYLMHPPMLDDAGLGPALHWYARGFTERSGIQVEVDVPAKLPRQSQELETTVFRIVQEALTNVHRYSGSRTAQIRIACQDGEICAEVRDQGCGLPPPSRSRGGAEAMGVGIAGMRERVKQLNGSFAIESAPGQGTTVRVTLPTVSKEPHPVANTAAEPEIHAEKGAAKSHGA